MKEIERFSEASTDELSIVFVENYAYGIFLKFENNIYYFWSYDKRWYSLCISDLKEVTPKYFTGRSKYVNIYSPEIFEKFPNSLKKELIYYHGICEPDSQNEAIKIINSIFGGKLN